MNTLAIIMAHIALLSGILMARSTRGGFSGAIGSYLSVPTTIAVVALLVFLGFLLGWWTIASFVILSIGAGFLSSRDALYWWVSTQPVWMVFTIAVTAGLWIWKLSIRCGYDYALC